MDWEKQMLISKTENSVETKSDKKLMKNFLPGNFTW